MRDPGLGGDDDALARDTLDRLADDRLGAVDRGGVEEIDAQVQGLTDKGDGFGRALAGAEPEPAEAAAAETGDTDLETGPAEVHVIHDPSRLIGDIRRAGAATNGERPPRPRPDCRRGARAGRGQPPAKAGRAMRRGWYADALYRRFRRGRHRPRARGGQSDRPHR